VQARSLCAFHPAAKPPPGLVGTSLLSRFEASVSNDGTQCCLGLALNGGNRPGGLEQHPGTACAAQSSMMMDFALGMLAVTVVGGAYAFYAAARAPYGYEDEQGFHLEKRQPEGAPQAPLEIGFIRGVCVLPRAKHRA